MRLNGFRSIETMCATPVPSAALLARLRKGWQQQPIGPDEKHRNDLLDVRSFGINGANQYYQENVPPYHMRVPGSIPNLLVRSQVAVLLDIANLYLLEHGMELFVFDGWRPQAVQHYCRNVWFPAHLKRVNPGWSATKILEEVNRYWADAAKNEEEINPTAPPPHSTGGSVDLTIRITGGDLLPMGTHFDECIHASRIDAYEQGQHGSMVALARKNRRLLSCIMQDIGFIGHPNEWWHWSYGDQAWALARSRQEFVEVSALFGAINPLPMLDAAA